MSILINFNSFGSLIAKYLKRFRKGFLQPSNQAALADGREWMKASCVAGPLCVRVASSLTCRSAADGSSAVGAAGAAFQVEGQSESQGEVEAPSRPPEAAPPNHWRLKCSTSTQRHHVYSKCHVFRFLHLLFQVEGTLCAIKQQTNKKPHCMFFLMGFDSSLD